MADHDWLGPTLERISGLVAMPDRHNSYGCAKVSGRTAHAAVEVLMRHMRPWTPAPTVMPKADGGLVLEWHEKEADLVVEFPGSPADLKPGGDIGAEEWHRSIDEALSKFDEPHLEPKP